MVDLNLRESRPQEDPVELARLVPAFLEIWNDPTSLPFLSFTQRPFDEEQVRGWLQHHLDHGVRYLVAAGALEAVAAILAVRLDRLLGCEILGLGVRPGVRRGGLGSALVEQAVRLAAQEGYRAVEAAVFADNRSMLRLLLARGFVPVRMEHRRRADGADLVFLKRYLPG